MQLKDEFTYLVGGYFGVNLIDEYPLKVYILKDIENYINDFVKANYLKDFDYKSCAFSPLSAAKVRNGGRAFCGVW